MPFGVDLVGGGFGLGVEMDGGEEDVPMVLVEGESLDKGVVLNEGDVPGIASGVHKSVWITWIGQICLWKERLLR